MRALAATAGVLGVCLAAERFAPGRRRTAAAGGLNLGVGLVCC